MHLSENARITLEKRYLKKDEKGNAVEEPEEMLQRVAANLAEVEVTHYGKSREEAGAVKELFYSIMDSLEFMPNSPTLMNAGRELQQLSACFVLPVEDGIEEIFESLKHMALVQKTGGGTGFSFGGLRPSGDMVKSTNGVASGPVPFLKIFDAATEGIKQGGTRRGANMGVLNYDHPDLLEFITSKDEEGEVSNFNISVAVSDDFMQRASGEEEDSSYCLVNPRSGDTFMDPESGEAKKLDAPEIFNLVTERAWSGGDPGLIFIDRMNRDNPTPHLGWFEATNPCGEQPLLPFEACCLGSINLGTMVEGGEVKWERLKEVVRIAVHLEDNVIDATRYVIPQIEEMHKNGNRKIGLGVMGWHDMLVRLGIPYDSEEALQVAEEVMAFIDREAKKKSVELAEERGVFPNFSGSIYDTGKAEDRVRNATRTTIAPTGTISIVAGASSGIEPYFSIAFLRRNVLDGVDLPEVNPLFLETAHEQGFYSQDLINRIAKSGTVQGDAEVPSEVQELFKTALEIDYRWHIRHQAVFQKYTDNAVSKTINFPSDAGVDDVKEAYFMAWRMGCKGITVYRDGSKSVQVLNKGVSDEKTEEGEGLPESLKPSRRPYALTGQTIRKETAMGNLFVTLNRMEDRPFELFAQIGKAGSDVVAFTEAVARLVSLALRCGISLEEIVRQLEGIGGGRYVGFGPNRVLSVPDAIGKALKELSYSQVNQEKEKRDICPDCGGGTLVRAEGCAKCEACGFSEC